MSAELAAKIKDLVDTPGISLNKMQQANLEAKNDLRGSIEDEVGCLLC